MSKTTLKDLLIPPEDANGVWFRQRGRIFEKILNYIFGNEEMEPRTSMRPTGEEIDGSFSFGNSFYLLEAKWHANPIPASSLYAFKGKVDGKLIGTIGVFFSMSDYSKDAVDALINGKDLNIILFGHNDLLGIDNGIISMREAMKIKLRYAVEYGQPFYPLDSIVKTRSLSEGNKQTTQMKKSWHILVEGEADVRTISLLLERFKLSREYSIIAAGGHRSIVSLAKSLITDGTEHVAAIITPVGDSEVQAELSEQLNSLDVEKVSLNCSIEDWLGEFVSTDYFNATIMLTNREGKMARRYARNADINKLLANTPSFESFLEKLQASE
tara:strand:- start:2467 stop:3447 length:981 start_codon:yes stop_codon:yes gene_type:complete